MHLCMSRRFLLLLALVVLVGIGTKAFAASFTDTEQTVYAEAFAYLSEKGIVRGYSDGLARPHLLLNRAEALKVLLLAQKKYAERVAWYQQNMPPLPLFSDIQQNQWYAPLVETAFELEIARGYSDGTFLPGRLLTAEEAVVLLTRAFGEEADASADAQTSSAIENRPRQWYTSAINTAINRNLIVQESRPLQLGQPVTRGQFFEMVYRMMRVRETGVLAFRSVPVTASPSLTPQPPPQTTAQVLPSSTASQPYASEQYFAVSMPSLGIQDLTITHPIDPLSQEGVLSPLKDGVGHLFSYPGAGGKIMIYGHSSGYPWDVSKFTKIFRKVNQLRNGDRIFITYSGMLHTYEVTFEETIDASDTSPFNDDGSGEELLLYTCWPPDSIAQRYVVHARPVDSVALR